MRCKRFKDTHLFIQEDGLVYSTHVNRYLSTNKHNGSGYKIFSRIVKGKLTNTYTHRAVAEAFIPNPGSLPVVNHINGVKSDNRVTNLEWVTSKQNSLHAKRLGLTSDRANTVYTLTDKQVIAIRHSDLLETQLCDLYNITPLDVRGIRENRGFTHIPLTGLERGRGRLQSGTNNNNPTSINPIEERVVIKLHKLGQSNHSIADLLQIQRESIRKVIKRAKVYPGDDDK